MVPWRLRRRQFEPCTQRGHADDAICTYGHVFQQTDEIPGENCPQWSESIPHKVTSRILPKPKLIISSARIRCQVCLICRFISPPAHLAP